LKSEIKDGVEVWGNSGYKIIMESYFKERSRLFNEGSEFLSPDSCERYEGLDGSNGYERSSSDTPDCLPVRWEQASSHPSLQITLVVSG
jgi:hypothetical protein